jgi:hypothetical protein
VVTHCFRLEFFNPAATHHSRISTQSILRVQWGSQPANPRLAELVECCVQGLWLLAAAALEDPNAQQILETLVVINLYPMRSNPTRPKMIEMSLPLLFTSTGICTYVSGSHSKLAGDASCGIGSRHKPNFLPGRTRWYSA